MHDSLKFSHLYKSNNIIIIIMNSVVQTVDFLISDSLSILWKALANKQDLVEKLHYADTKVEVVIMTKLKGTWVLAVAKAVLDVVLSVAASVILTLLLISGNVEENPGPVGGISNCLRLLYYILIWHYAVIFLQTLITRALTIVKY